MRNAKELFKKHCPHLVVGLLCMLLIVLTAFSFAWFGKKPLTPIGGEVMPGYFAGGEGTAEKPYVINRPIHLYNLAWLQNTGRFNQKNEDGTYTQFHFVLADDVDMTGLTLPPIGTTVYPFIGTFESEASITDGVQDDVKYTIKNLTVSNMLGTEEISKRPQAVTELVGAEVIGMFGVIGVYDMVDNPATFGNIVPSVSDFYLEDPVVRAQTEKTLMGLIAGYVNGKLHNVGVLGGRLESGAGNTSEVIGSSVSYYALIGNKSSEVNWGGVLAPGKAPGTIKVDANDGDFKTAFERFDDDGYVMSVPGSATDRAFIVGSGVDTEAVNGNIQSYFYKTLVTATQTPSMATPSNSAQISASLLQQGYLPGLNNKFTDNADFYTRFKSIQNQSLQTGTISFTNLTTVTLSDHTTLKLPSNCVWFKPAVAGNCIISFMLTSSDNAYKSIYKFQRDANGNMINRTETELSFAKAIGNKNIVCFQYEITAQDVKDGFEYAIGSSSVAGHSSTNVNFYFLALAGASATGSVVTQGSKELLQVNFVDEATRQNNGNVAADGFIITTFDVRLTGSTPALETVSFARTAMNVDATATTSGQIYVDKYSHTAIVLPNDTGGTT